MIETFSLGPGIRLRCVQDVRFKQGCLCLQLVRPMDAGEAAMNALLPAVLLRGTRQHPTLRHITMAQDDLYGAGVSPMVRRLGDYQTVGLYCGFMDQRFALPGDRVLEPMAAFLRELMMDSTLENGAFAEQFVESEKKNQISAIECDRNDKQAYATERLLRLVCSADRFGLPRMGEPEEVAAITPAALYAHYRKILRESPILFFYVGSAPPEQVAQLLTGLLDLPDRAPVPLPPQTGLAPCPPREVTEHMDITQSRLCMGYVTPITERDPRYPAMVLLNQVFGAGMTSKLFVNLRERRSLCYSIGSGYYGAKGIVTVSAGIDGKSRARTQAEIARQLDLCAAGEISQAELDSAREGTLSALRAAHDSPGAIVSYDTRCLLSGIMRSPQEAMEQIRSLRLPQLAEAAKTLRLHSTYFLTEGRQGR